MGRIAEGNTLYVHAGPSGGPTDLLYEGQQHKIDNYTENGLSDLE